MCHSDFYKALSSNDAEETKQLLQKYTDAASNFEEKACASLAQAYEEIKIKNIPVSEEIDYLVTHKLVHSRFFMVKDNKAIQETKVTIENAMLRIRIIQESANFIVVNHQNKDIDDEFVVRVKIITQHMTILKKFLKTTYDKLPWEEMEFCLQMLLIIASEQNEVTNLYKLVLDRRRVLYYLKIFTETLSNLSTNFKKNDINPKMRLQSRDTIIKLVTNNNPAFISLYADYETVRDIYSLRKIDHYIQVTLTANSLKNLELEKLIIQRTLQVIGEYLKNSVESPNVSNRLHKILIESAPTDLKDIITSLRDSLSHAHSLVERFHIERNQHDFFNKLQNDLKIIQTEINIALNARKVRAIVGFAKKIRDCSSIEEANYLLADITLSDTIFYKMLDEQYVMKEVEKIEKIFREIYDEVVDKTSREIKLFMKIEALINTQKQKTKKSEATLNSFLRYFNKIMYNMRNSNDLNHIKKVFFEIDQMIMEKSSNNYAIISHFLNEIYTSLSSRKLTSEFKPVDDLINHLMVTLERDSRSIKKIQEFKVDLDKEVDTVESNTETEVENIIKKLMALDIPENCKNKINEGYESKKLIPDVKSKLYSILKEMKQNDMYEVTEENLKEWQALLKQLDIKKQSEDSLILHYKNKNTKDCENLLNLISDTYTILQKSFKDLNIFINDKQQNALKGFLTSLKLKKNEVEDIMKKFVENIKNEIKMYFTARLNILNDILFGNDHQNINEFIKVYMKDRILQIIVEALVLDLFEILEDMSFFTDNRLFTDNFAPLLIGKALRNFLAHGNVFLDNLPYKTSMSLLCNALKLIECGENLLTMKNVVIGKISYHTDDFIENRNNNTLKYIKNQTNIFTYALENDIANIEKTNSANIFACNIDGHTPFHYAAKGNAVETFEFIINKYLNLKFKNCDKNKILHRAIHLAAVSGSDKIIAYFLANKLDISTCSNGTTVIHLLAKHGHTDILENLITHHSMKVNVYNNHKRTPLHMASELNQLSVVKLLLSHGANVRDKTNCSSTALHYASRNGHETIVELLLNHPEIGDINEKASNGYTPLHYAAENGHVEVVKLLLKNNPDLLSETYEGLTALELSVRYDQLGVVEVLYAFNEHQKEINRGGRDNNKKHTGATLLRWACRNGHASILSFLLNKGCDPNEILEGRINCLHVCAEKGHREVGQILIAAKVDVNLVSEKKLTPLYLAASNGHIDVINDLLSAGALKDTPDPYGLTPLCVACLFDYTEVVVTLLNNGADINFTEVKKITPLHASIRLGKRELVQLLLAKGADVNARTSGGVAPLHLAALYGYNDVLSDLLNNGAIVDIKAKNNYTPLHVACRDGCKEVVQTLLDTSADINAQTVKNIEYNDDEDEANAEDIISAHMWCNGGAILNVDGLTPLHFAAQNGHIDIVQLLLMKNVNFDIPDEKGVTPLTLAAQNGFTKIVNILISKGADVNVECKDKLTPLISTVQTEYKKTVSALLNAGAMINAANIHGYTALHFAALYNSNNIARILINRGAEIDSLTLDKFTPLHFAVLSESAEVLQTLIKGGANLNARGIDEISPLDFAVFRKKRELIKILCASGAEVNYERSESRRSTSENTASVVMPNDTRFSQEISRITDELREAYPGTPLLIAIADDSYEVVCDLLSYGADPNFMPTDSDDTNGCTMPLHIACLHGQNDIVRKLIESGAGIEARSSEGFTPLLAAVQGNQIEVVKTLLEAKADANVINIEGGTPMIMAILKSDIEVMEQLIKYGAVIDKPLIDSTPLYMACKFSHFDKAKLLLENNADVNIPTKQLWTPLHVAASNGSQDIVSLLLDYEAEIEFTSIEGLKPLHLAAQNGCLSIVRELLARGAKFDVTAVDNATPLYLACSYGHLDVVECLLEYGANTNIPISKGLSPLDEAVIRQHTNVVGRLLRARADMNVQTLHLAILHSSMEIVCDLLVNGAIIDSYSEYLMLMRQTKFNSKTCIE